MKTIILNFVICLIACSGLTVNAQNPASYIPHRVDLLSMKG